MSDSWVCSMSHGTLLPQCPGEFVESDVLPAHRGRQPGDPQRGEVVGVDRAVELTPRGRDDPLARCAECLEDRHLLGARCVFDGDLDVGQHPVCVGVCDEQRPSLAGGSRREVVAVHQPHTLLDGVNPEARPGDVEERHRRQHLDGDLGVALGPFEKLAHGPFQHQRGTGDGVEDLGVTPCRLPEFVDDRGVHLVERVRGVVQMVERGRIGNEMRRWVATSPQEAVLDVGNRTARLDGDVVDPTRSEPDDDDAVAHPGRRSDPRTVTSPAAWVARVESRHPVPAACRSVG